MTELALGKGVIANVVYAAADASLPEPRSCANRIFGPPRSDS